MMFDERLCAFFLFQSFLLVFTIENAILTIFLFFFKGWLSRNAGAMVSSTNSAKSEAGNESYNRAVDATMGTQDVRMHPH